MSVSSSIFLTSRALNLQHGLTCSRVPPEASGTFKRGGTGLESLAPAWSSINVCLETTFKAAPHEL